MLEEDIGDGVMEQSQLENLYLAEKIIEQAIKIVSSGHNPKIVCEDAAVREAVERMEQKNKSKRIVY